MNEAGKEAAFCPYPHHRPHDWRRPGGKWICGICHPPPRDAEDKPKFEIETASDRALLREEER